jgi:hypothetical protein
MPTSTAIAASNPNEREPVGPSPGVRALATAGAVLLGMRGLFPVLAAGRDHGGPPCGLGRLLCYGLIRRVWSGATLLLEEWASRWLDRSIAARDRAWPGWIHRYYLDRTHIALGGPPLVSRVTNLPGYYTSRGAVVRLTCTGRR